jgi:8-oxo-dGTP pyrophosphatase MutT (NUDIX family)
VLPLLGNHPHGNASATPTATQAHPRLTSSGVIPERRPMPKNGSRASYDRGCSTAVVGYVEREDELLVFDHRDHPEAGTQVPTGSVLEGEAPTDAAVREVREETGLELRARPLLVGTHEHLDGLGRPALSYFFRVDAPDDAPDSWEHLVDGDGAEAGPVFLCRFDAAPTLWPVQAVYLSIRGHS